jgi:hypothetical protein
MHIDPHERHEPMFCGVAITTPLVRDMYGTLGCFIRTTGRSSPLIAPGVYLLTNYHVIGHADPRGQYVIQMGGQATVLQPEGQGGGQECGYFVYGIKNSGNDCAICKLDFGRSGKNKIPNRPGVHGFRKPRGIGPARVGDVVYKYGATTGYTEGIVRSVDNHLGAQGTQIAFNGTIRIEGVNGGAFCGGGDSGSLVVRKRDDVAVGLLFLEDSNTLVGDVCRVGHAYDLLTQMDNFVNTNGTVELA